METNKKAHHQTQSKKTMPMTICRDAEWTKLRQKKRSSKNQQQLAHQQHLLTVSGIPKFPNLLFTLPYSNNQKNWVKKFKSRNNEPER